MKWELPMQPEEEKRISEAGMEALQWAKDFMNKYERKHRDRLLREGDTITYTSTGDGGSAPRVGPRRD